MAPLILSSVVLLERREDTHILSDLDLNQPIIEIFKALFYLPSSRFSSDCESSGRSLKGMSYTMMEVSI